MWLFVEVQLARLMSGSLTSGQLPRLTQDFGKEWRLNLEVLGHDIEAEEVSVYAFACHGLLVAQSVSICCYVK